MAPYVPPAGPPDHSTVSTLAGGASWLLYMIMAIVICTSLASCVILMVVPRSRPWSDSGGETRKVRPTPPSDISKLMMKGRIELYRWSDLLTWYDQQAELAGLRVIHPTNSTVTTEYVSSVK